MTTTADLSARQLAVAKLIAFAKTDQQIAAELGLSDRRIRFYVESLVFLLKLDPARNVRIQIALWWREHCPVTVKAS